MLGFKNIQLLEDLEGLTIFAENTLFLNDEDALKTLSKSLGELLPKNNQKIKICFTKNNIPAFCLSTFSEALKAYAENKVDFSEVLEASQFDTKKFRIPQDKVYLQEKLSYFFKPN